MKNPKKKWNVCWSHESLAGFETGVKVIQSTTLKGAEHMFSKRNKDLTIEWIEERKEN